MNGTEKAPVVVPTSPLPDYLAKHLEGHARQIVLPPNTSPSTSRRRTLDTVWADDIKLKLDEEGVIEGILPRVGLIVAYGDSNVGKTFAALDQACHIAAGRPWRGKSVEQGVVVYVAAEAPVSLQKRVVAWKRHHDVETLPLVVVRSSVDLLDPEADTQGLLDLIREVEKQHGRVALVVIDTLARAIAGGNENAPDDMGAFVGNVARLRDDAQTAVMIVHHAGKDAAKGARGHSSLRAATDVELEITQGSIRVTKSRDGESGHSFGFRLEVVELGTSTKGKPITTCVAVDAEAPVVKAKKKSLGDNQRIVFDALTAALVDHGQKPPPRKDIPPHVKVVTTQKWEEYSMRYLPHTEVKVKSQAWKRAMKSLVSSRLVRCAEDFVWLPPR